MTGTDDLADILNNSTTSTWLKDAARSACARDPVDALNDAEVLATVLARRVANMLRGRRSQVDDAHEISDLIGRLDDLRGAIDEAANHLRAKHLDRAAIVLRDRQEMDPLHLIVAAIEQTRADR